MVCSLQYFSFIMQNSPHQICLRYFQISVIWLILWTSSCISKIVVTKRTRVHACCCEANCQQPELHRHRFGFHTHCTKARGRGHTCKFSRKTCRSWCIQFGLTGDLKSIAYDLELRVWSCVSEGVDFTHIEKYIYRKSVLLQP